MDNKNEMAFARKSSEFEKKAILEKISRVSNLPTPSASNLSLTALMHDCGFRARVDSRFGF
jgi:hypothetical protein